MSVVVEWLRQQWRWFVVGGAVGLLVLLTVLTVDACNRYRVESFKGQAADAGAEADKAQTEGERKQGVVVILKDAAADAEKKAEDAQRRMKEVSSDYDHLRDAKVTLDDTIKYLWE